MSPERPAEWRVWGVQRGIGDVVAIGEIFGVHSQATTDADPTDGLF
jgi:hypothetical protein